MWMCMSISWCCPVSSSSDSGAQQGGGRVVGWPPWILEQGQWPPWISSMFWFFLWSNISRKQTRQYRKSTTTTSIIPVRYGAVNKWRHESIMDSNKFITASVRTAYPAVDPETWFSVNFQKIVVKIRLPPGLCPGPRWGLTAPPDPQLEKVGLDHPVENSFPRHALLGLPWFLLQSTVPCNRSYDMLIRWVRILLVFVPYCLWSAPFDVCSFYDIFQM